MAVAVWAARGGQSVAATEEWHIAVMKGSTKKAMPTRLPRLQGPVEEWNKHIPLIHICAMEKSIG